MDIQTRPGKTLVNEDQRWVAPAGLSALRDMESITLDRSAFDMVTKFPSNYIPSGVLLGKITASGKYGPYAGGTDEVQRVTITGTPTGGTFTLTFEGQTTAGIAFNATAAQVRSALEALSNIAVGDVTTSGGTLPGTAVDVTFTGALGDSDRTAMTANAGGLTGGSTPAVVISTVTAGSPDAASDGRETAMGLLGVSIPVSPDGAASSDIVAALYWHGAVVVPRLPANSGLDTAARADLSAKFRFIEEA